MFRPAHWTDGKLEVNFQITASTCSECSDAVPRTQLKDEGPCLESGAVPQGWSLHPTAALWGSAALTPYSPPTADSGLLWFVSSETKGDGGSCSILAEAKLFWLSLPQQNPSCICHTTERAVMTNLDSCNSSAYYKGPKNCRRNSTAQQLNMYKHPKEEQD